MNVDSNQDAICKKYSAEFFCCPGNLKLGISSAVKNGVRPINGLRLIPENGTCGWFIWAGEELSDDPDFFLSLHVSHLAQWAPLVIPYLGLPPGWRFLISENYEDVWKDDQLLQDTRR